jgi:hypothetical protein
MGGLVEQAVAQSITVCQTFREGWEASREKPGNDNTPEVPRNPLYRSVARFDEVRKGPERAEEVPDPSEPSPDLLL